MFPHLSFQATNLRDSVQRIHALAEEGGRHYVCFCEANLFVNAWRKPAVLDALRRAALVYADGISVLMMARLQGRPVPKRVPGPSVLPALCEHGVAHGLRHFFLGGGPGVPERMAAHLQGLYPGIEIVGAYSPPYRALGEEDNVEIRRRMEAARPHFLWVGLGAPKQELWMAMHHQEIEVPVMLGVGAAFDFHAGTKLWAPLWIRKLGMEWAFRMVTGGRRTLLRNLRSVSLMSVALVLAACGVGRKKG